MDRGQEEGGDRFGMDFGARRYGPDTTRFIQQDLYYSALGDLSLSLDPLTQNRYSLAGGNPVSFVEVDGHHVVGDGGGCSTTECKRYTSYANRDTELGTNQLQKSVSEGDGSAIDIGFSPVEAGKDVLGVAKGVGEAVVEAGKGAVETGKAGISCARDLDGCERNIEAFVGAVRDDPGGVASAMWHGVADPIAEDFRNGNPGEAAGRFAGLLAEIAVGAKGATRISKLGGTRSGTGFLPDEGGEVLYRVHGGKSGQLGSSWTPTDPRTLTNPRGSLGLPSVNSGEYLTTARVTDYTGMAARRSLALGDNLGGEIEYLVPNPSKQLEILEMNSLAPPY